MASKKRIFGLDYTLVTILVFAVLLTAAAFLLGKYMTEVEYLKKINSLQTVNASLASGTTNNTTGQVSTVPLINDSDHVRGSRNAPVVIYEYADLECPFCKQFHPILEKALADYGDKVAWVWRQYPLTIHANAQKEAEASECVNEIGGVEKFWQFVDKVFQRTTSNGTGFSLDKLAPLAGEIGVDQAKFSACFDSGKYAQAIKDDIDTANKIGISATPGNVIVGKDKKPKYMPGAMPYEKLKQAIDDALK